MAVTAQAQPMRLVFFGNSHLTHHGVPRMVQAMLQADGRTVEIEHVKMLQLNDVTQEHAALVKSRKWDAVVLQGAATSQSHKYVHPQTGLLMLANAAKQKGLKTILMAEWPREGWDEAWYIYGVYRQISDSTGAQIAPACFAWAPIQKQAPNLRLWEEDGNHSSEAGAYVGACTIYQRLRGAAPKWAPKGMASQTAKLLQKAAADAIRYEGTLRPKA